MAEPAVFDGRALAGIGDRRFVARTRLMIGGDRMIISKEGMQNGTARNRGHDEVYAKDRKTQG